jgi:hypothetical protein
MEVAVRQELSEVLFTHLKVNDRQKFIGKVSHLYIGEGNDENVLYEECLTEHGIRRGIVGSIAPSSSSRHLVISSSRPSSFRVSGAGQGDLKYSSYSGAQL